MWPALTAWVVAAALGLTGWMGDVSKSLTQRMTKAIAAAEQTHAGRDRYIDCGIRVYIVKQDLDNGVEVIPGTAPVVATAVHELGGMVDSRTRQYDGPSEDPVIWLASERQWPIVSHENRPDKQLVYGAMGAGKTRGVLAPWLVLRSLELVGLGEFEGGATAPTSDRTALIYQAIREIARRSWYRYFKKEGLIRFRWGTSIRLITTTPRSAELGSPIQGWNWAFAASDELQDSIDANGDIEARGRRARIYRRCSTATAKDHEKWRAFKDRVHANKNWEVHRLEGPSNPLQWTHRWEELRHEMSEREYQRKVLALDVGPERAVYPAFSDANIRPLPRIGARDQSLQVLRASLGIGNDPGTYRNVSIIGRPYYIGNDGLRYWWALAEVTTGGDRSFEHHVLEVKRVCQEQFNTQWDDNPDLGRALVRCEPYGDSESRPDHYFYKAWKAEGFTVGAAAFRANGTGRNANVPLEPGVEMVNRLLCNAAGVRRLFIATDENGKAACPMLAKAFRSFERDDAYKAKGDKRHKEHDLSDWPMALTLLLWPYERLKDGDGIKRVSGLL